MTFILALGVTHCVYTMISYWKPVTGCSDGLSEKDPEQSNPKITLGKIPAVTGGRAEFPVPTG